MPWGRIAWPVLAAWLCWGGAWGATDEDATWLAPAAIEGILLLDAEGLVQLAGESPDLVIVDSRTAINHKRGYIEGSISLPDTETHCETLASILPAKETPVVFHCNGPRCQRSGIAAKIALSCGYKRVYWFRGGIEEWQEKDYPLRRE
jgi:rhodanese-related sulfurtransferase